MSILRLATENTQSDWRPVFEGLWRWEVGKPELVYSEKFKNYQVKFPHALTQDEQERMKDEQGDPPEGVQQSYRASYKVGLSFGFYKDNQYKSTKMIDFLAACFGSTNQKKFRDYVAAGGGPDISAVTTEEAEQQVIESWLGWVEGLEVYGTIRHEPRSDGNGVWANFAGPLAVGSLPGQKDDAYQAVGRGKLRAMIAEGKATPEPEAEKAKEAKPPRTYDEVFESGEEAA